MARNYGFRLFVVQAFSNRIAGRDAEDVSVGSPARHEIVSLLEQLHQAGTQFLEPRIAPAPGEPERPVATVTVGDPAVVRNDLVHVNVAVGEQGSHRQATRRGRKPRDLEKWSPEADHYVTFVFPI